MIEPLAPTSADPLVSYGWTPDRERAFAAHAADGFVPGRVVGQNRVSLRAATATGLADVVIQRGFRRAAGPTGEFPTVGDWLALEPTGDDGQYLLREILPRSSAFVRGESFGGNQTRAQVLAANIDSVLIVAALSGDFNVRRIERYLSLAWASGAQPVIVLNKADLCDELEERLAEVYAVCGDVPVHALSAATGDGVPHLLRYLTHGSTLVLLGSSGVGKSTLANALLGYDRQLVSAVREDDDRGRHTTTGRELFSLPTGALLIDTPGLRSVGLWDAEGGASPTFEDIDEIERRCRFPDCGHEREPGCAIRAALADGTLDPARLASRQKLERELRSIAMRETPGARRAAGRSFARMVKGHAKAARWKNGVYD
jgi:ribosome biogenesis GTPase / thiamine phosphate phosphatase